MNLIERLLLTVAIVVTFALLAIRADARVNRWTAVAPHHYKLERIAACESGKRWWISTGNGYYGGLQFSLGTWSSVGGRGLPSQASKLEQKYRAVLTMRRRGGWGDWPVCGQR